MDHQTDFEREVLARLSRLEDAVLALSGGPDAAPGSLASVLPQLPEPVVEPAAKDSGKPFGYANAEAEPRAAFPHPKPHRPAAAVAPNKPGRGADWWLARAGAVLTTFAVILLYRYAIDRGWITSVVRVLTGVAIGAALMYWGRKMPAADNEEASPVALRELMMGAALATWYISAFAASVSYHLIEPSTSRILFLVLSIVGTVLGLRERRSLLAIVAVGAGFLAPVILPSTSPSIPAFAVYLAMIGSLGMVLYLMRGWQSVLWLSAFSLVASISQATTILLYRPLSSFAGPVNLSASDAGAISLTLLIVAMAAVFTRAPSLRRDLVATGSERYPEPLRSKFAHNWLSEIARLIRNFSPAANQLDSLSMWFITISAPLAALGLLSQLWLHVNTGAWGAAAGAIAMGASYLCNAATDENSELTHIESAAFVVWRTAAFMYFAAAIPGHHTNELILAAAMISAALAVITANQPRFSAGKRVGRAIAVAGVGFVVFSELALMQMINAGNHMDRLQGAMSLAEVLAIVAGIIVWRDLAREGNKQKGATAAAVLSYGAFLLLDARALGEIWAPLVSATFAIAGTSLLLLSRKTEDKLQRAVGGATLALVVFRLFFVDLAGVDTIWRVFLFLGIGALFLFASRQLQSDRPAAGSAAPESS